MSNTNCLQGMKCPKCDSEGPFEIEISSIFLVSDEGVGEQLGDNEWTLQSYCGCRDCPHFGTVGSFKIKKEVSGG